MRRLMKHLWLGIALISMFFMASGSFFVSEGINAKKEVKETLAAEKIVTAKDASIPEVTVDSPATAKSQADIIQKHTLDRTEGKTYAELTKDDPNRDLYIKAVSLRTALMQAYMGFKIADLVIGVGALAIAGGAAILIFVTPLIYRMEHTKV